MKILIADDDGMMRRLLTKMLHRLGYEVMLAQDGDHAWRLLQQPNAPLFVILDWMMPGMDGVDICARLRLLKTDVAPYVILLSGMDTKKNLIEGFNAGADDYMTKPFDPNELFVRIRAGERIVRLRIESLAAHNALRKLPTHDALTGVKNLSAILDDLSLGCEKAIHAGHCLSVIAAEIDNLPKINVEHGKEVYDKVIIETARLLAYENRSYESVGRIQDGKFIIILHSCDAFNVKNIAERIQRYASGMEFDIWGAKIPITMSFGTVSTSHIPRPTPTLLMGLAEEALIAAQKAGGNCVESAKVIFPKKTDHPKPLVCVAENPDETQNGDRNADPHLQ